MYFDIIFVDVTNPRPYDAQTINTQALGGTEATVIRVAEGLAKLGYKVGVLEHNIEVESMGFAYYLPIKYIEKIKTRRLVSVRSTAFFDIFPKGLKKYSWQHNEWSPGVESCTNIVSTCAAHNGSIIAVSQWHENNIRVSAELGNVKTRFIYNPCPDEIYLETPFDYDKTTMVWAASPHKGLARAAELLTELRKDIPNMEMLVFNPGYLEAQGIQRPNGMTYVGSHPPILMWEQMAKSLCTFYPTEHLETFGCIAAESNALRTPIATNAVAALNETVCTESQLAAAGDFKAVIEKVKDWYTNGKPNVKGQDRFKTSNVLKYWEKLLRE